MKFELKDYSGQVHEVDIPDGTKEVAGVIVSGDEILVYPVYSDPMCIHRLNDFLDGPFYRVLDKSGAWIEKEE